MTVGGSASAITEDILCSSAGEFVQALLPGGRGRLDRDHDTGLFRGVGDAVHHRLVPTALRPDKVAQDRLWRLSHRGAHDRGGLLDHEASQISAEQTVLKRFFLLADQQGLRLPADDSHYRDDLYFPLPSRSEWELALQHGWISKPFEAVAGLAQHYGLPTRLLDWSRSPLVSGYFAATSGMQLSTNTPNALIAVWSTSAILLKSCAGAQGQIPEMPLRVITPPYAGNPNLAAQQGVFTHWHINYREATAPKVDPHEAKTAIAAGRAPRISTVVVDRRPLDELIAVSISPASTFASLGKPVFRRTLAPVSVANEVLALLNQHQFHAARLFPGYGDVVLAMDEESLR